MVNFIIIIVFHSLSYYYYYYFIIIIIIINYFFSSPEGDGGSPFLRGDTSINVVSFSLDMSSWLAVITVWRYWKINHKNAILNFYTSLEKTAQFLSLFCFVLSQWNVNKKKKFWNILCCLKRRPPSTCKTGYNIRKLFWDTNKLVKLAQK